MTEKRKLQSEIDRVLKKIQEGMEIFNEIWDKVHNAPSANQKEKYEGDLKKEIKKLQRYRDQVKTWAAASEVKNKKPLLDARKQIESQMERFKVLEKESKTKAYSKEGLNAAMKREASSSKDDPAKVELLNWLDTTHETLGDQLSEYEERMEKFKAAKTKKTKSTEEEADLLRWMDGHHFHLKHLDALRRAFEEDETETEKVSEIKEDIDYYVSGHQDPDYSYDPALYEPFNLDLTKAKKKKSGKKRNKDEEGDDDDDFDDDDEDNDNENGDDGDEEEKETEEVEEVDAEEDDAEEDDEEEENAKKKDERNKSAPLNKNIKTVPTTASASTLKKPATAANATTSSPKKGPTTATTVPPPITPARPTQPSAASILAGSASKTAAAAVAGKSSPATSAAAKAPPPGLSKPTPSTTATPIANTAKPPTAAAAVSAGAAKPTTAAAAAAAGAVSAAAKVKATASPIAGQPTPVLNPPPLSAPGATTLANILKSKQQEEQMRKTSGGPPPSTSTAATGNVASKVAAANAAAATAPPPTTSTAAALGTRPATNTAPATTASTTGVIGTAAAVTTTSTIAGGVSASVAAAKRKDGPSPAVPTPTAAPLSTPAKSPSPIQNIVANVSSSTTSAAPSSATAPSTTTSATSSSSTTPLPGAQSTDGRGESTSIPSSVVPQSPANSVPPSPAIPPAGVPGGPSYPPTLITDASLGPLSAPPTPSTPSGSTSTTSSSASNPTSTSFRDRSHLPEEYFYQLQLLESSRQFLPESQDSDRPRVYIARNPYRTPSYFPSQPAAVFEDPAATIFEKFSADTLFFIFYFQQGTPQQYLAARELKKQNWRYHKNFLTWFQRHDDPQMTTDEFEKGTYLYFDYETGWNQRIKADFTFEYRHLEDELTVPSSTPL